MPNSLLNLHQFWFSPNPSTVTASVVGPNFLLQIHGQICDCFLQQYWTQVITPAFLEKPFLWVFMTPHYFGFHLFSCLFFLCFLCWLLLHYLHSKCRSLLGSTSPSVMLCILMVLNIISVLITSKFSTNLSLNLRLTYPPAYITSFLLLGRPTGLQI